MNKTLMPNFGHIRNLMRREAKEPDSAELILEPMNNGMGEDINLQKCQLVRASGGIFIEGMTDLERDQLRGGRLGIHCRLLCGAG